MSDRPVLVGAVAYHPRVVTIWESFLGFFEWQGASTDYVLYSSYERLVEALLAGEVDIGWNTNTAYLTVDRLAGGGTQVLGMRSVDRDFRTIFVTRRGETVDGLAELAGRRIALGSRDSGHAAILPLHYLEQAGVTVPEESLLRFDTDLGKHGDTGSSELDVVRAVAAGEADAGALGQSTWATLRGEGSPAAAELEATWTSPVYYHCNFTALPGFDRELAGRWSSALLAMDYSDPTLRTAMTLEGVREWLPGDIAGYRELELAMERQGYLR